MVRIGIVLCVLAVAVATAPVIRNATASNDQLADLQRAMYKAAQRDNDSADAVEFSREPQKAYFTRTLIWGFALAMIALAAAITGMMGNRMARVSLILAGVGLLVAVIRLATVPWGVDDPIPSLDGKLAIAALVAMIGAVALFGVGRRKPKPF